MQQPEVKRKTPMLPKPGEGQPKNRIVAAASAAAVVFLLILATQFRAPAVPMQLPVAATAGQAPAQATAGIAPTVGEATSEPTPVYPTITPLPPVEQRAEAPAAVVEEQPVEVVDLAPPPPAPAPVVVEEPLRVRAEDDCAAEHGRCPAPCTAEHGRCEAGVP